MPPGSTLPLQELRRQALKGLENLFDKLDSSSLNYKRDPKLFFAEKGITFFPEFEKLFQDLYSEVVKKAVALGPRGGGKTFGAALLAVAFFLFKDFDVGVIAGSETQALTLFGYITEWLELAQEDANIKEVVERIRHSDLVGKTGNRIVAKTASARSIRGMHLGRNKRGALLIIDEEAEVDEDVLRAARYTVRTAKPAIILRMSTYHKLTGSFARLVETHKEQGYSLFHWDSFDIAQPCPYDCAQCPVKEFLDKYCKGKAKASTGWIDINEIIGEWKDTNKEAFEVEVMGTRPAAAGLIIQPEDVDNALIPSLPYAPSEFTEVWLGVDWGFASMTAVVLLGLIGEDVYLLFTDSFSRHGIDSIVASLKELRKTWRMLGVYPDSSHPFENNYLRDNGFPVWGVLKTSKDRHGNDVKTYSLGVPFVSFKEEGVSLLAFLFEKGRFKIPPGHEKFLRQLRTWRRDDSGHIVKKDDHYPDASLAAMKYLSHRIGPKRTGEGYFSVRRRAFIGPAKSRSSLRKATYL